MMQFRSGRMLVAGMCLAWLTAGAAAVRAAEVPSEEQQVAERVKAPTATIVHLWAPWCSNCLAELKSGGWTRFLADNPDVQVVFVTIWRGEAGDGRAVLEKHGLGGQSNFTLVVHPNGSRTKAGRMTHFLGMPVTWVPSTWVYRAGTLRYALNYGEVDFDVLQKLVRDATRKW